ncbi:MAG: HAD-IG family 5'-nucleotidase [Pseudomonadota bacterium]
MPNETYQTEATLASILGTVAREADIPRTRRVYVNRNLRMDAVDLIGFDMDYTLAVYNQRELDRLSIELTLRKLVDNRGYPPGILELDYSSEWSIRGLVVDRFNGNMLKMDRHGHVGRVYHGSCALAHDERAALYRRERIRLSAPRYAWIDTLFALPEGVMYLRLVQFMETVAKVDYSLLWQHVRESIDEAHRDDSLKSVIRSHLDRFVQVDPDLPATLHRFRSSGKRLFLLTNSLWHYTDTVMRFLLDNKLSAYPSWRNYFDIIIVGGAKPAFFTERSSFVELDPHTGAVVGPRKTAFLRGHVYQAGNLADFERMAGHAGDRVLYIGDHIYGDILRAKKSSIWRTAMIVQELEAEIAVSQYSSARIKEIDELDRRRRNLEAEIDFQQLLLKSFGRHCDENKGSDETAALELSRRQAKKLLESLRSMHKQVTAELEQLDSELDRSYNPYWGPIFREANESSRFGQQVEYYACLYTSRVSNFLLYSPLRYFRAPRDQLPHEIESVL